MASRRDKSNSIRLSLSVSFIYCGQNPSSVYSQSEVFKDSVLCPFSIDNLFSGAIEEKKF